LGGAKSQKELNISLDCPFEKRVTNIYTKIKLESEVRKAGGKEPGVVVQVRPVS
jgi:hypothetical protein